MDLTNATLPRFPPEETTGSSFPGIDFTKSQPPCHHVFPCHDLFFVPALCLFP